MHPGGEKLGFIKKIYLDKKCVCVSNIVGVYQVHSHFVVSRKSSTGQVSTNNTNGIYSCTMPRLVHFQYDTVFQMHCVFILRGNENALNTSHKGNHTQDLLHTILLLHKAGVCLGVSSPIVAKSHVKVSIGEHFCISK